MIWIPLLLAPLFAQDATELFEKSIRPTLVEKCYSCHSTQSKLAMGGLRLDDAAALRKGGDSGPAIIPGDPAKGPLMEAIRYQSLRLKMPPTGKLSDAAIRDFETWIRLGAPDPRTAAPTAPPPAQPTINFDTARRFWSLQPLRKPALPSVKNPAWIQSPIDAFLLAKLESQALSPAPPAAKRDWLRRVTFDLTGLPPTPAELRAYLADNSPQADRTVVERLLASPHYGERWARHWLDLVRFAETNGHEFDNDKLDAWRYRDYVIRAFNEDIPYHQFAQEHIAGDLLPNKRLSKDGAHWESPLGTGMLWFGEVLNSATDSVKSRADTVDNQIDVMGKAFLGLTVACARCHDHKFDPIPTADYYSLAGIFHSTYIREAVIDAPSRVAQIASIHQKIADINREIERQLPARTATPPVLKLRDGDMLFEDFEGLAYDSWFVSGQAFGQQPFHRIPPNQPLNNYAGEGIANSFGEGSDRLVGSLTSRKFKMPKLWVHIRMAGHKGNRARKEDETLRVTLVADDHKSAHFVAKGHPGFEWVSLRMTKEIGRTCYFEIVDRSTAGHLAVDKIIFSDHEQPPALDAPPTGPAKWEDHAATAIAPLAQRRAALEQQLPPSAFAMLSMDDAPHSVKLHIRGNHQNLGEEVPRRFLRALSPDKQSPVELGSGRLELAAAIGSGQNPLTARVLVNRVWKHHFTQGLVRSLDNFGKMGEPPSHPELLDYLAASFIESNWSIKQLHRTIVLSAAYRMSNIIDPKAAQTDPRNALLHHMPVRRLEAEAIRDSLLAVSGKLDPTLYGPSVPPHISKYQDGRGKPASGPLDGNGRRSIYIQVRRNFIPPMFLAFDYPLPVSAIGNRNVSTVPAQALMLLNNEFVASIATTWAQRLANEPKPEARVAAIFETAFSRPPESWETTESLAFASKHGWDALCHTILNSAEFIYVR